ncbi:MAG: hypothetical protein J6C82_02520 [Clostridia bacterium]|nr:hypothetical protein [Clostridia bacterium]
MKFLEHMSKIDNIIAEKKEEQHKKELFDISSSADGLGFTTITPTTCGSMTNVAVTEHNVNGCHTDTYTVFNHCGGGYTIF